jgi:hypothetical protein
MGGDPHFLIFDVGLPGGRMELEDVFHRQR